MLILTSNGLSSRLLLEETARRIRGKSAALITTASLGYKEKDWNVPRLTEELRTLGLSAECVDLDEEPPENLLSFDVIELMGGNPFYLLKRMKETDCVPVLQTLAAEKTVIGVSAGSLVLQASIELAAGFTPEMNRGVGLSGLSGLGLTQLEIFPHYHKFLPRFDRLEERIKEYESRKGSAVIRLDDGQGIFEDDENCYLI